MPTQPTPPPCPTPVPAGVTDPPARIAAALAYDGSARKLLLFSGVRGDGTPQACAAWIFGDTWTWDGSNWTQLHPLGSPPGRSFGVLAYDPAHGNTVLFGGGSGNSDAPVVDTWTWEGTGWTPHHPTTSPPWMLEPSATYDSARRDILLVGSQGTSFQTWIWNGSNWTQQHPAHNPPFRFGAGLAYDAARGQVLLFGGRQSEAESPDDTWTWNGVDWQQQHPSVSPPPIGGLAAYDPLQRVVVLYVLGQTWTWNGSAWTVQHPITSPPTRVLFSMVYDDAVGKVLISAGKIQDTSGSVMTETVTNETWLWDGTTWTLAA